MYEMYCGLGCLLLALVAGTALLAYTEKQESCCKKFYKVVGYFVIVVAVLGLACFTSKAINSCGSKKGCALKHKCETKSCCALKKGAPKADEAKPAAEK